MAVRYATLRFPQLEAVVVPELSHLTDVVVLPAVGDRSTASEMGGGDYDGGTLLSWGGGASGSADYPAQTRLWSCGT